MPGVTGGVKWYAGGKYLDERPVFTLDPAFHAGGYYPQEASSMLVGTAIRQGLPAGIPVVALDLAAAPGGKSTLLAESLPGGSLLLANEVIRSRHQILRYNLQKWGYPNAISSNHDPSAFRQLAGLFDLILVDAPCSGEGLFRKDPHAMAGWSPNQIHHCSLRQKRILKDALPLIRPGGLLLYSTCTYNEKENRAQVAWLNEQGFSTRRLDLHPDWGITDTGYGYQCYPHRLAGEGFFLAVLQKSPASDPVSFPLSEPPRGYRFATPSEKERLAYWLSAEEEWTWLVDGRDTIYAIPDKLVRPAAAMLDRLNRSQPILEVGRWKGKQLIPAAGLAFSLFLSEDIPRVDLPREEALRFLKKELHRIHPPHEGWGLATFGGWGLGWFKGLKTRINNYYPTAWRIRMDLA